MDDVSAHEYCGEESVCALDVGDVFYPNPPGPGARDKCGTREDYPSCPTISIPSRGTSGSVALLEKDEPDTARRV